MKKYAITLILSILTGMFMSKIIFDQYSSKMVSKEQYKAYFFEVGIFDNIKNLNDTMKKYNSYIYVKKDNKYYAYIGITIDNYEKIQSYFDKMGYVTKVREINVSDKFKSRLKEYDLTYQRLKDEIIDLKFQNTNLSNKVSILENTITVLKRTIERVANFFYNLVADKLISKEKEKEIHQILGNDYKLYKEKSKDDGLSL